MSTDNTVTTTRTRLTSEEAARAPRAGWLLTAAFLAFVGAVVMMIVFFGDYDSALTQAAETRGVPIDDLPAEVIAPIHRQYTPLWQLLAVFGPIVAALMIFAAGVRAATRVRSGGGPLAVAAIGAACLMPAAWLGLLVLESGIGSADPSAWTAPYDALYAPLTAVSTIAGSLAVIATAVVLRRADVARRTGLVVIALSALLIALAPFSGTPPIIPLLLGAVVGIVLIRTARGAA